jgi:hypothetical protein
LGRAYAAIAVFSACLAQAPLPTHTRRNAHERLERLRAPEIEKPTARV